jgi:uncharacterized protein YabE (DUF348 family)
MKQETPADKRGMRRVSRAMVMIGVLIAVLFGAGGVPAAADERQAIKINGNNVTRAASCRGQSLLIDGNANHVQLRGHCRRVHINGNDNVVVLHAVVSVVSVNGNHNQVYVSISHNPMTPRIHDNGSANVITGIP